jgi:hypothetical protein
MEPRHPERGNALTPLECFLWRFRMIAHPVPRRVRALTAGWLRRGGVTRAVSSLARSQPVAVGGEKDSTVSLAFADGRELFHFLCARKESAR